MYNLLTLSLFFFFSGTSVWTGQAHDKSSLTEDDKHPFSGFETLLRPLDPAFRMVANELNGISIEKDLTLQELNKNIEEDLQTIKIVSEVVERGCLLCILFFFFARSLSLCANRYFVLC